MANLLLILGVRLLSVFVVSGYSKGNDYVVVPREVSAVFLKRLQHFRNDIMIDKTDI